MATKTAAKEHPILFSGPMVCAILDGRKTQTRRVVKLPSGWSFPPARYCNGGINRYGVDDSERVACPYGQPGDRLWCREVWQPARDGDTGETIAIFRADWESNGQPAGPYDGKWRPSIHMPRWASRITLEVTDVRVERLQEIGKDGRDAKDVLAEGVSRANIDHQHEWFHPDDSPAIAFSQLWDSINAKRGFSWDSNPWVWVVSFKRIDS